VEQKSGIHLVVSYDGTAFAGWQVQPNRRTVQAELERAVEQIAGHPVRVRGASRTDAGVHALGQVAAFDSARELLPRNWILALNSKLPEDIAVRQAVRCEPGFRPRHDALDKTYRYLLHIGVVRDPLLRNRVWHLGRMLRREFPDRNSFEGARAKLDLGAMRQGAQALVGTHDFRAFRAADDARENTVRTLYDVAILERYCDSPDILAIEVRGSSFLKAMVRIIVGTLVEVGRGRLTPEQVRGMLTSEGQRPQAGKTAPACGLTLVNITLGRKAAEAQSDQAPDEALDVAVKNRRYRACAQRG
jgi:tRNA pseudouridine38-40 synthase